MARKRKKKTIRVIYQSLGPLPIRLADQYAGQALVFSDASAKRHGGLAAVLFSNPEAEAIIATQTVPLDASNSLEFQAALFALSQASLHFSGRPFALFTDNLDAAERLKRAKLLGLAQDAELTRNLSQLGISDVFALATIGWVKGHSSCRGNTLADQYAGEAAS
jgi:ribonuclease HI